VDKCFFCGNEGSLVLHCKICQANNILKTIDLFTKLTSLEEVAALKERLSIAEGLLFKITHNELCHCAVDGENCYIEQAKDYLADRLKVRAITSTLP